MVRNLGVPVSQSGSWSYVNTSGDPYETVSADLDQYGRRYLLPYCRGELANIVWEMVPSAAAVLVSFIHCIPARIPYNEVMEVYLLPGDRSLLVSKGEIYGYCDGVGGVVSLLPQNTIARSDTLDKQWRYNLSSIYRNVGISNGDFNSVQCGSVWVSLINTLLENRELTELSESLQSRLRWELRMRRGA